MGEVRRAFVVLAFAIIVALGGCRIHAPSEIDVRTDSPDAAQQNYEPSIVIISGAHRRNSRWLKVEELRSHRFVFVSYSGVEQVVKGEKKDKSWFKVWTAGTPKVLSVPPGHYSLIEMFTGPYQHETRHRAPKPGAFDFTVKAGDVVNLGYIESWYSRKDKGWLDVKNMGAQEDAAIQALTEKFGDPAPYIARMKTRLLNVPEKLW